MVDTADLCCRLRCPPARNICFQSLAESIADAFDAQCNREALRAADDGHNNDATAVVIDSATTGGTTITQDGHACDKLGRYVASAIYWLCTIQC